MNNSIIVSIIVVILSLFLYYFILILLDVIFNFTFRLGYLINNLKPLIAKRIR